MRLSLQAFRKLAGPYYFLRKKLENKKLFNLLSLLLLLTVLPVTVFLAQKRQEYRGKAQTSSLFSDDFETDLSGWILYQPSGNNVSISSDFAHSGSKSMKISYSGTNYVSARKRWSTERTGIINIWFYDDLTSKGTVMVVRDAENTAYAEAVYEGRDTTGMPKGHTMMVGVKTDQFPNNYYYRIDDTAYNSQVPRKVGWHKFAIVVTSYGSYGLIDDLVVACNNQPNCTGATISPQITLSLQASTELTLSQPGGFQEQLTLMIL